MRLPAWIQREGTGAITQLQFKTRLAYSTILRAIAGKGVTSTTAQIISKATRGEVSVGELCEDQRRNKRSRNALRKTA